VGLLVRALGAKIARYCAIVVESDPLGLLVQPIAHWDVEIADLAIVEHVPRWRFIERSLVMEHLLFEAMEAILISLVRDAGASFSVSDGLEEPISDAPK
jgi:hypothetical protein